MESSMDYEDDFLFEEDKMGMTITSGKVVIQKDNSNLIGISIGGGAPLCPCLYIVQIFDNTPAAQEGTLEAGDELVSVNNQPLKGKTKVEVAKLIQSCDKSVIINYNKLHADLEQGRSLDIILKKVKHRLVESMGSATADALGLSRAILCNDTLVQRLTALEKTEYLYKGLVAHAKSTLHSFFDLFHVYKVLGDAFASMGVKEPQPRASEAFTNFGELHRQMEKVGIHMLKTVKPILKDLGTYLHKAIPDTRMTISKYADAKFEYLSYCLKVKEMDDEEQSYLAIQEPLYRIETGNYEYRLILRCRQNARTKFAKMRSDVLVKLELLDNKHVEDVVIQLQRFSSGLANYYTNTAKLLEENIIFPVEIDLSQSAFQYKTANQNTPEYEDDEDNCAASNNADRILDFDNAEEAMPVPDLDPTGIENQNWKLPNSKKSNHSENLKSLNDLLGELSILDVKNDHTADEFESFLSSDTEKETNSPTDLEKLSTNYKENVHCPLIGQTNDTAISQLISIESNNSKMQNIVNPYESKDFSETLLCLKSKNEESLINID